MGRLKRRADEPIGDYWMAGRE